MATYYLVSCVSQKNNGTMPLELLYRSAWFQKARAFVKSLSGGWFILSAQYGLARPEDVKSTYNRTLNEMSKDKRRTWADNVFKSLSSILKSGDVIVILAGRRYREFLEDRIRGIGVEVRVPMERMRIGEQLRWLSLQISVDAA